LLDFYKRNPKLRAPGSIIPYTEENIQEYKRCLEEPMYFFENYIWIIDANGEKVLFKLRDYQKSFLQTLVDNRFTIACCPRQVGKCCNMNTLVKIRSKKTGEIKEITLGELFDRTTINMSADHNGK